MIIINKYININLFLKKSSTYLFIILNKYLFKINNQNKLNI